MIIYIEINTICIFPRCRSITVGLHDKETCNHRSHRQKNNEYLTGVLFNFCHNNIPFRRRNCTAYFFILNISHIAIKLQ